MMDEEKKEKSYEELVNDIIFTKGRSLFASEEDILQNEEPALPITHKEMLRAEKEQIKAEKKQRRAEKKTENQNNTNKRYPDKIGMFLGVIVSVFAVVGVVLTVWNTVRYISKSAVESGQYAEYNEYLTPIVAVDIDAFDDITSADKEQLLNAAIWSILSDETTPDTYKYSGGYMLIPAADIEKAYGAIFGPEAANAITHMTVQGYNSVFEYNATDSVYKIPVTTISPVYTPRVTDVTKSGTALVVTADLLAAESWMKDEEGNFVAPEPDKVVKITLRELQGSYFINAIQTVSSTVPETITFEVTSDEYTSDYFPEPTTANKAERTTLGGKVQ